jgi:uncharacterized protein (TIGR00255 family)
MTTASPALCSMTGFASASRSIGHLNLSMELRAVNHRYLDLQFKLPEELRVNEAALREMLTGIAHRGKVECRVQLSRNESGADLGGVNEEVVARLLAAQAAVQRATPSAPPLSVHEILRWPGVVAESHVPPETLSGALMEMMKGVVADFVATRAREGAKLRAMILERTAGVRDYCAKMAPRVPELQESYGRKLAERIREAGVAVDPDRLAQELALFASRIDVAEELSRLAAHVGEVERVLAAGGACGKRLDFLMQELNREANTFGSKSVDSELTRTAVELKVLIEQMREQVQNIE